MPVLGEAMKLLREYHLKLRIVGRDELSPNWIKEQIMDLHKQSETILK